MALKRRNPLYQIYVQLFLCNNYFMSKYTLVCGFTDTSFRYRNHLERKSFKITKVLTTRQLKQILIDDDDVADIEKKKCTSSSS